MATLQEILERAGTLENAEHIARFLSNDDPKYLMDLQLVLSAQGKVGDAWEVSNRALELYPDDPRVAFNRGWLVMQKGDLLTGLRLIDKGRSARLWGDPPIQTNLPMWDGEKDILGKTILLYCEAGFGDEIMLVRFVKLLVEREAKVIVACKPDLVSLFSRIDSVSAVINKIAVPAVYHDYWVPSMSVARLCGVTYDSLSGLPYLLAHPNYSAKWEKIIGQRTSIKVGIRWSGNPQFEHDQHRSIPAEMMLRAVSMPDVGLYSLQRDDDLIHLPDGVVDLGPKLETWEDTAAAVDCLDLVITSCTAMAHLSAALGKPAWVIVPVMPYYVWAWGNDSSCWYDSVRLFRQEKFGVWSSPLEKVRKALEDKR